MIYTPFYKKPHFFLVILIALFVGIYYPHAFILNEDVKTIEAFGIDEGLMIESALQHINTYNLQVGYMSKFYGWSYFFVNYICLKPLFLVAQIFHVALSNSFSIFLIRNIFFLIGLSSCCALFILLKKIFQHNLLAFLGTLLYIIPGIKPGLFIEIKPEITGLLFFFCSQIALIDYIRSKKTKKSNLYYFGIVFLTLSVLAKQSFVFLIPPTVFLFYLYYTKQHSLPFFQSIFKKKFGVLITKSLLIVIGVVFLVYPHLFRHPQNFIVSQQILLQDHGKNGALVLNGTKLLLAWSNAITNNTFIKISLCFLLISTLILVSSRKKNSFSLSPFFITAFCSIPIIIFILCSNSRLFISNAYLLPLFLHFILSYLYLLFYLIKQKESIIKKFLIYLYYLIFCLAIFSNIYSLNQYISSRKNYQSSQTMEIANTILQEIPLNSKIAISDGVLIAEKNSSDYKICHWWNSCNTKEQLDAFSPNYLIFRQDTSYNNIQPHYYQNFEIYAKEHNCILLKRIGKFVIYENASHTI